MEGELTHVLEGHTRDILCLDVQKEAAFSGTDGNYHNLRDDKALDYDP